MSAAGVRARCGPSFNPRISSAPNFVRGTTVLMTLAFNHMKPAVGVLASAQIVAVIVTLLALLAISRMKETFACDLNFLETR